MSIYSTNPYVSALAAEYYTYATTAAGSVTPTDTNSQSSQIIGGLRNDSFELSPQSLALFTYDNTGNYTVDNPIYAPPPPPPQLTAEAGSTTSATSSLSEMFSKLDTDSDGSVSQAEFLAARPDDVTEEMATNLYNSFDTDSSGTLTETEYVTAMNNGPTTSNELTAGSSTTEDPVKSFLDKVASGTATDADLQSMQAILQSMLQQVSNA